MIFDYITEFAGYLNDRGYAVTQNKISRFLSLKLDMNFDYLFRSSYMPV